MTSEDSKIAELEQIIGYSFANKLLAAEALQMAGKVRLFTVDGASRGVKKNIDLALVGNSILATILCKMWYQARDSQGNRLTPGHWNDIRQQKLSNDSLGGLGFEIGIHRCIMKEAGLGRVSKKMVAQTVEAVIGAVYMDVDDNGMESVRAVIQDMGFAEHPHLMFPRTKCLAVREKRAEWAVPEMRPGSLYTFKSRSPYVQRESKHVPPKMLTHTEEEARAWTPLV